MGGQSTAPEYFAAVRKLSLNLSSNVVDVRSAVNSKTNSSKFADISLRHVYASALEVKDTVIQALQHDVNAEFAFVSPVFTSKEGPQNLQLAGRCSLLTCLNEDSLPAVLDQYVAAKLAHTHHTAACFIIPNNCADALTCRIPTAVKIREFSAGYPLFMQGRRGRHEVVFSHTALQIWADVETSDATAVRHASACASMHHDGEESPATHTFRFDGQIGGVRGTVLVDSGAECYAVLSACAAHNAGITLKPAEVAEVTLASGSSAAVHGECHVRVVIQGYRCKLRCMVMDLFALHALHAHPGTPVTAVATLLLHSPLFIHNRDQPTDKRQAAKSSKTT